VAREEVAGQIKAPQPDAESKTIRDGPSHSRRVLVRLKFVVDGPARKPIQNPKKLLSSCALTQKLSSFFVAGNFTPAESVVKVPLARFIPTFNPYLIGVRL